QATGKVRPGPDSRCRGHRRDHTDAGCARRLVGHGRCLCRRDGLRPAHAKSRAPCISESTRGGCWCGAKSTSSTAASSCATTAGSRFDTTLIQPYGCISADRAAGLRPRVRRPRGSHTPRHRPPRDQRRGGRPGAGQPLPDELRGGPEARRGSRARRPDHEAAHRPPQGRPHQPRGAARRASPARPVRRAVAGSNRSHERAHRRDRRRRGHRRDKGEQPMTVIAVRKDPQRLTLTVEAEFDTSVERIWLLWADPRQLERWWGPPTYPATFTKHDLAPGSRVEYHMTGPTGDQPHGYWDVLEVEPLRRILFRDCCDNADGTPRPMNTVRVGIEEVAEGRTRMSIEITFPSIEAMDQALAMGTDEGLSQAVSQIDPILAEEIIRR